MIARNNTVCYLLGFISLIITTPLLLNVYFLDDRIAQNFEDVIYPKGDPDAVSISKRDVDLLLPETFINDTIIDFYIK